MGLILKLLLGLSAWVLLSVPPVSAQAVKEAAATKAEGPIRIDGVLDEDAWGRAQAVSDFVQFQPERGVSASAGTTVRVLYDGVAIYFAFENADPETGRIAARIVKRDADLKEDDAVGILP